MPCYYVSHGRCGVLDEAGWERVAADADEVPVFARYGCSMRSKTVRAARLRPFPFAVLGDLSDKCRFASALAASGNSGVAPETFTLENGSAVPQEVLRRSGALWYVKEAMGSCQNGLQVFEGGAGLVRHLEILQTQKRRAVVQRGVTRPHLLGGRKWVLRMHFAMLPDLSRWIHQDGVVCIHPGVYAEGSTDPAAQWQQRGAKRVPFMHGPASALHSTLWPQLRRTGNVVLDLIEEAARAAADAAREDGSMHYALVGADVVVDEDGRVWLLEVNTLPWLGGNALGWSKEAQFVASDTFSEFVTLCVLPAVTGAKPEAGRWRPLTAADPAAAAEEEQEGEGGCSWEVHPSRDAFGGRNAATMPAATGGDLSRCRRVCIQRGYGGFAVWKQRAYFRSETAERCRSALRARSDVSFHIPSNG
eukprot:TRINITY_DN7016_c0_g1_i1.p1 TRINITY_DN7016_c0_g1~~TRINITY_DN7016_c0_g1_i1.p1  ORF type:complete len:446 (+),score=106.88 TRINITY_DN7016_c0_g1_i1:83-1339(+)